MAAREGIVCVGGWTVHGAGGRSAPACNGVSGRWRNQMFMPHFSPASTGRPQCSVRRSSTPFRSKLCQSSAAHGVGVTRSPREVNCVSPPPPRSRGRRAPTRPGCPPRLCGKHARWSGHDQRGPTGQPDGPRLAEPRCHPGHPLALVKHVQCSLGGPRWALGGPWRPSVALGLDMAARPCARGRARPQRRSSRRGRGTPGRACSAPPGSRGRWVGAGRV